MLFRFKHDALIFCDRLYSLLSVGNSLQRSLDLLNSELQSSAVRRSSGLLKERLLRGESFTAAIVSVLGVSYLDSLRSIEVSVSPCLFIQQLSSFIAVRRRFISSIISVSVYPAFLFMTCLGVFLLVWFVFLPQIMAVSNSSSGVLVRVQHLYEFFGALSTLDVCVMFLCVSGVSLKCFRFVFLKMKSQLSVEHGVMLWLVGVCCSQGVSLNAALSLFENNKKLGGLIAELQGILLTGDGLQSYFVSLGLINIQQKTGLGETFIDAGNLIFDQSERRLRSLVSLLSPFLLILVGAIVFLLVYLLFVPLLSSIKSI